MNLNVTVDARRLESDEEEMLAYGDATYLSEKENSCTDCKTGRTQEFCIFQIVGYGKYSSILDLYPRQTKRILWKLPLHLGW